MRNDKVRKTAGLGAAGTHQPHWSTGVGWSLAGVSLERLDGLERAESLRRSLWGVQRLAGLPCSIIHG